MFATSWLLISLFTMPSKFCHNCQSFESDSIVFSGVWKVWVYFWFYLTQIPISDRSFPALKQVKTYVRTTRAYRRGNMMYIVPTNQAWEGKNTYVKFFCNQAQNF